MSWQYPSLEIQWRRRQLFIIIRLSSSIMSWIWGAKKQKSEETAQNTLNTAAIFLALFLIVKIIFWQPKFIHIPTPPLKFNWYIPRDLESCIGGCWSPNQSLEQTKIPLWQPKFLFCGFTWLKSHCSSLKIMPVPNISLSHQRQKTLGPWSEPSGSPKYTSLIHIFPSMAWHG